MSRKMLAPLGAVLVSLACSGNATVPASANNSLVNSESSGRAPNPGNELNWVRYTDSAEGAFSMEVPVGWQVQGGMYRFGYFDVRWMMDVRSLDGKVILRIQDANVPGYSLPGPNTGPEGTPYSRPQQLQMMIARYRTGQTYAELYAKHRFSGICRTVKPRRPDWVPTTPPAWRDDPGTEGSDGSVSYDCDTSDGPRIASVYVHTTLNPKTGVWFASPISILVTADRAALAYTMVQHMIDTWQKNPRWVQYQNQMTQVGLDQVRANFQVFMHQMQAYHQERTAAMNQQVAGFEARQSAQAQQVSNFGEILTGVQSVSDPMTGSQFQVYSGPKANYYINGNGVKINSTVSPGPGFHQLTPVQP